MRDRSQARCVLVQPQVATVLMIVADVSSHEPDEMTCTENHDVLKELATAAADPVLCQNSAVIRKKENRPEAADYGRSNPRNQRRLDFLRSTGRLEMVSVFMGSDSATKMEISANRVW